LKVKVPVLVQFPLRVKLVKLGVLIVPALVRLAIEAEVELLAVKAVKLAPLLLVKELEIVRVFKLGALKLLELLKVPAEREVKE